MQTIRTTVVLDFEVEDGTDPDAFHDELRDALEADQVDRAIQAGWIEIEARLESVRDINCELLED